MLESKNYERSDIMTSSQLILAINTGKLDSRFTEIYGEEALSFQKNRYINAIDSFASLYGDNREISLFSVAGRSELSGNHTDHNRGLVIAGSIDLDIIAVASGNDNSIIRVKSEGYDEIAVDINEYTEPKSELFGTSDAIVAGMCRGFADKGYITGGFDAYMTSSVLKGSGLSSSAAFEDMIGNIENHLYNNGQVDNVDIAKLSQYAENVFFGKPCGLMDQVACAHGGMVAIDFADTKNPIIEKMDFDLTKAGYNLCIVDTGGNHADLTDDYASIPYEMKSIAKFFGKEVLRELDPALVYSNISKLRATCGDRAILRAIHFFRENQRVKSQKASLDSRDLDTYFKLVKESGRSSFEYLQNVYTTKNVNEQGLSLALALADGYLNDKTGAYRVHGGGFAGTIQAYVKKEDVEGFKTMMDAAFGEGACLILKIRQIGACRVF